MVTDSSDTKVMRSRTMWISSLVAMAAMRLKAWNTWCTSELRDGTLLLQGQVEEDVLEAHVDVDGRARVQAVLGQVVHPGADVFVRAGHHADAVALLRKPHDARVVRQVRVTEHLLQRHLRGHQGRGGQHLLGRVVDQQAAVEHVGDAVRSHGLVHVVRAHQQRHTGRGDVLQDVPEGFARLRVHAGGGLVEQQDARAVRHRAGQGQALLPAARHGAHALVVAAFVVEGELLDQLGHPTGHVLDAVELADELQVLAHRQVAVEAEVLGHVAQQRLDLGRLGGDVEAQAGAAPRGQWHEAAHHADGGCLARAVGAEEAVELAFLDGHVELVDDRLVTKGLGEVAHLDDGLGHVASFAWVQDAFAATPATFTPTGVPGGAVQPAGVSRRASVRKLRRSRSSWLNIIGWVYSGRALTRVTRAVAGLSQPEISTATWLPGRNFGRRSLGTKKRTRSDPVCRMVIVVLPAVANSPWRTYSSWITPPTGAVTCFCCSSHSTWATPACAATVWAWAAACSSERAPSLATRSAARASSTWASASCTLVRSLSTCVSLTKFFLSSDSLFFRLLSAWDSWALA